MPRTSTALLLVALLAGCSSPVGGTQCSMASPPVCQRVDPFGCDATADMVARTPYYHMGDSQPAYPGQALIIENCITCHQPAAPPSSRHGAPAGLDFDVRLVTGTGADAVTGAQRLLAQQHKVHNNRDGIYSTVESGQMPPNGFVPPGSQWADADGNMLPGIFDSGGHRAPAHLALVRLADCRAHRRAADGLQHGRRLPGDPPVRVRAVPRRR